MPSCFLRTSKYFFFYSFLSESYYTSAWPMLSRQYLPYYPYFQFVPCSNSGMDNHRCTVQKRPQHSNSVNLSLWCKHRTACTERSVARWWQELTATVSKNQLGTFHRQNVHIYGLYSGIWQPLYPFKMAFVPLQVFWNIIIAGHRHRGRSRRHRYSGIQHLSPVPDWSTLIPVPDGPAFWHLTKLCKGTSTEEGSSVRL